MRGFTDEDLEHSLRHAESGLAEAQVMVDYLTDEFEDYIQEWLSLSTEPRLINGTWESVYREQIALRAYLCDDVRGVES